MRTVTTPYRSDDAALHVKKESLQRELADVEAKIRAKRILPMLDNVKVATPCPAKWDDMIGDAQSRHCLSCEKSVYNLSAMTREDAEAFLAQKMGTEICVRFYQRADGTIMTSDCSVGVSRKRRRRLAVAVAGVGAAALAAVAGYSRTCTRQGMVMGEMQPLHVATTPSVMGSFAVPPPPPAVEDPVPGK